jgi:hypothetical protein
VDAVGSDEVHGGVALLRMLFKKYEWLLEVDGD